MRGMVTVLGAEEYQKWFDETVAEQAAAATDPFR
jgi:hypothetical protein